MKLSEHITLSEATFTSTGLPNNPPEQALANMILLCRHVFEPLRRAVNVPIRITSMYRSQEVNKAVGGASTSQHVTGQAMDIQACTGATNAQLFHYIRQNLKFDQLIWELGSDNQPAWVHVSYSGINNRMQVLRAININGRIKYESF